MKWIAGIANPEVSLRHAAGLLCHQGRGALVTSLIALLSLLLTASAKWHP